MATSVPLADGQASRKPECTSVLAYERDEDRFWRVDCSYIPAYYPGTGDVFASVLTGSLLQGDSLAIALDRAVQFVTLGIRATFGQGLPTGRGDLLERILIPCARLSAVYVPPRRLAGLRRTDAAFRPGAAFAHGYNIPIIF